MGYVERVPDQSSGFFPRDSLLWISQPLSLPALSLQNDVQCLVGERAVTVERSLTLLCEHVAPHYRNIL